MGLCGCLETVGVPPCAWFEGDKRNAYASMLAGLLFFAGWWTLIDAATYYPGKIAAGYWFIGIAGSISLFMVNSVSNSQMTGDAYEGGCLGTRGSRLWLFVGFVMGFAAVIASCAILFAKYMNEDPHYPGVALFLQNALICISSIIYKFARSEDVWG